MRDQIRGVSYAAIAAAAMLLSFAASPAQAQGMPGGSYLQSCTNVRMHGDRLVAECRRADGGWERTALNVGGCAGGIANTNGQLTCNYSGGPGYGSSYDRPSQDRYYGYPRYYGYGR
jgi:N-methylhydantoinase B/oxoprolinase/acetone carboxylase alpha subunit